MSKVVFKTREILGEMIYETQYEFENASDFLAYEEWKESLAREMAERMKGESGSVDLLFEVKKQTLQ